MPTPSCTLKPAGSGREPRSRTGLSSRKLRAAASRMLAVPAPSCRVNAARGRGLVASTGGGRAGRSLVRAGERVVPGQNSGGSPAVTPGVRVLCGQGVEKDTVPLPS